MPGRCGSHDRPARPENRFPADQPAIWAAVGLPRRAVVDEPGTATTVGGEARAPGAGGEAGPAAASLENGTTACPDAQAAGTDSGAGAAAAADPGVGVAAVTDPGAGVAAVTYSGAGVAAAADPTGGAGALAAQVGAVAVRAEGGVAGCGGDRRAAAALPRRRPACATDAAAGSATVELAAAIPLLVAVTLAMVAVLGLARDQVLAQGAAREGAREAAIGGNQTRALAAARAALPPGRAARVSVTAAGSDRVRVLVELPVGLPFGGSPVVIRATAVAAREPGPSPTPADS
jgi:hypothetical protein